MEWSLFIQEEVQKDGLIPFPEEVCAHVGIDHELDGPSVHWNYEPNQGYLVLSKRPLRGAEYVHVGRFKIYDMSAEMVGSGRIRIPEAIDPVIRSKFVEGTRATYLSHEGMRNEDNSTVYLLTESLALQMLPGTPETADIREELKQLPAFMTPP